jgi:hypothetical protein
MIFFISTQEKYPTLFIHFFYIISAQKTLNWLQHRMIFFIKNIHYPTYYYKKKKKT